MKKLRITGTVLLAACVILGVISFVIYTGQDHTAPEITVEEANLTYTEGQDYKELMTGVTAQDNRDGDLTEEVFVDKVIPTGESSAVVYYGVIDSAKNVGTASRTVSYVPAADDAVSQDVQAAEEAAQGQETAETVQETPAETVQEEQPAQDPAAQAQDLVPNGERPALALTAPSTTVAVGTPFNPMSVVQAMVDDKDTSDTLSQRVMVDGAYDTNVPGSYALTFYVGDSDGNTSDPVSFTLVVQ